MNSTQMTQIKQINADFFLSALISIINVLQSNQRAMSSHNCEAIESVQISQISVFNQRSIKNLISVLLK